jgi:hypothetical protein
MIKSILAWFAGLFAKGTTMTDETVDTGAQADIVAAAAPAPTVVAAPVAATPVAQTEVPTPDVIGKLETILAALGHELPVFWDEAVALAKKAL